MVAALALGGCGKGDGLVVVSVDSTAPIAGIAELHVQSSVGGRTSTQTVHPPAPFSLPPAKSFGIQVPSSLSGTFAVAVDAIDGSGNVLASASGSATLSGGGRANIELSFDSTGDMGAGDGGGSGGDLAGTCTPLAGLSCIDANTLDRCDADGKTMDTVPCPMGCVTTPTPHCQLVTPTGIAPPADFNTPGIGAVTLATTTMHSDTGQIEGVRPANGDPTTLSVDAASGIGFHLVTQGGSTVGVFVMRGLTITGTLTITGLYPVVILANGDVNIAAISAAAICGSHTPGPGGYAGGTPAAPLGGGPGGGAAGMQALYTGAGGGGHGDHGGAGAAQGANAGGAGGAISDSPTLAVLHGGSGGGAQGGGNYIGGAGGGAVQIVSQTKIVITGGIAAGGCGGLGGGGVQGAATCSGGGAGGAILLEAPTVSVGDNGYLVCGGGGGGGVDDSGGNGEAAADSNVEVSTGLGGTCGGRCGGQGGYSGQMFGGPGTAESSLAGGCGGGAAGRIRVNTTPGGSTFSATNSLYVPTMASMSSINEAGFSTGPIVIK